MNINGYGLDLHTLNVIHEKLRNARADYKLTKNVEGIDIAIYEVLFLKEKELHELQDVLSHNLEINSFPDI